MVGILIPWAGEDPWRIAALEWLAPRLPYGHRLAIGGHPWSKGAALWTELSRWDAPEIVVLHDADVWCPPFALNEAIEHVVLGRAAWAIPHGTVYRLSREGTRAVYGGGSWHDHTLARSPYEGMAGGGILIARREVLLDCPVDPRFVGWGQEDECHAVMLNCVHGTPWRGSAPLVHLWHPPQDRLSRRIGSRAGWALRDRYVRARRDRERMLKLQEEVHDALQPAVPDHHDRAPERLRRAG